MLPLRRSSRPAAKANWIIGSPINGIRPLSFALVVTISCGLFLGGWSESIAMNSEAIPTPMESSPAEEDVVDSEHSASCYGMAVRRDNRSRKRTHRLLGNQRYLSRQANTLVHLDGMAKAFQSGRHLPMRC